MFPDIILNSLDQIHSDNYIVYIDRNKKTNTITLRLKLNNFKELIEFAKLPLNVIFKIRIRDNFIAIFENKRLVLIFYIPKLVKLTNNIEYSSPLILKREK